VAFKYHTIQSQFCQHHVQVHSCSNNRDRIGCILCLQKELIVCCVHNQLLCHRVLDHCRQHTQSTRRNRAQNILYLLILC